MTFVNRALALAAGLVVCACGGSDDESDPKEALVGKWGAEIPGSPGCIMAGVFLANGNYEGDTVCPLDDGSYGIEAEVGTYSANGSVIDFVPTMASCRQPDRNHSPSSVSYSVKKDSLTLVLPSGLVVFERLSDDSGGSVVAHYGCANADGFVRSEVAPL